MKQTHVQAAVVLFAFTLGIYGWAKPQVPAQEKKPETAISSKKAVAVLHPTAGNNVQGIVTFTEAENGVRVVAKLTGVPAGKHGFHIHEYGDCSAPDATSAGGHFNPTGMAHAGPTSEKRHVGDLGNILADEQGNAQLDYLDSHLTMNGANSIIGRGLILHAQPDDFTTQPTGAAGARIACGVIGVAKE
jgi:Cu-Zn family superoxide dismutase